MAGAQRDAWSPYLRVEVRIVYVWVHHCPPARGWTRVRRRLARVGPAQNVQRVAPCGSAVATPVMTRGVSRLVTLLVRVQTSDARVATATSSFRLDGSSPAPASFLPPIGGSRR